MKKRYIVSIDGNISKEKENIFSEYLKENQLIWWHWLSNTWLIIDEHDKVDSAILRSKAKDIFGTYNWVYNIENGNWAGFGPNGADRNMFTWLKEKWPE